MKNFEMMKDRSPLEEEIEVETHETNSQNLSSYGFELIERIGDGLISK